MPTSLPTDGVLVALASGASRGVRGVPPRPPEAKKNFGLHRIARTAGAAALAATGHIDQRWCRRDGTLTAGRRASSWWKGEPARRSAGGGRRREDAARTRSASGAAEAGTGRRGHQESNKLWCVFVRLRKHFHGARASRLVGRTCARVCVALLNVRPAN